jgi:hypothetical protein
MKNLLNNLIALVFLCFLFFQEVVFLRLLLISYPLVAPPRFWEDNMIEFEAEKALFVFNFLVSWFRFVVILLLFLIVCVLNSCLFEVCHRADC